MQTGFEAPALAAGGFQYAPTGTAWAYTASAGVAKNSSAFTSGNAPAPDGTQVAFLQGQGRVSQGMTTSAAGDYTVTFRAAQRGNYNAGNQSVRVLVDGVVRGVFTPSGASYQTFTTVSFNLAAGSHTVAFEGVNAGDRTAFVDGVVMTATPPSLITGGGFEAPALAAGQFQYAPAGAGWTFSQSAGVSRNGTGFTSGNPGAPDGNQVAFLQGQAQASQAFTAAAGAHTVSFRVAQRGNYNPAGGQTVIVRIDGVEVGRVTPSGSAYQTFTTSFNLSAGGSHVLSLQGERAGESTALLDALSLI